MVDDALPTVVTMRPLVLLSGFLGAGKTTLLRSMLGQLDGLGLSADVILNDYENADLDAERLQERAASITPLSASCACCSGLDDLVQLAVAARKTSSDLLLIELNGTADPVPLLESFILLEAHLKCRPRLQVAVIDGRRFGCRALYNELEQQQLKTASHFVLTHTDSISRERREEVVHRLRELNPRATATTVKELSAELAALMRDAEAVPLLAETIFAARPPVHGHHLSHSFTGCQLLLPTLVGRRQMTDWLRSLPDTVLRAKALVTLVEEPNCRHLFERIGPDDFPEPDEVPISDRVPPSALFIGPRLDPNELLCHAREHFGPQVRFPDDAAPPAPEQSHAP